MTQVRKWGMTLKACDHCKAPFLNPDQTKCGCAQEREYELKESLRGTDAEKLACLLAKMINIDPRVGGEIATDLISEFAESLLKRNCTNQIASALHDAIGRAIEYDLDGQMEL